MSIRPYHHSVVEVWWVFFESQRPNPSTSQCVCLRRTVPNLSHVLPLFPLSFSLLQDEKGANVFRDMRIARATARMIGMRQKVADEKAAAAALKKK